MINILLIEDEEILGHLIREVLQHEPDFNVEWVIDGEAAVESVAAVAPAICVLDVMLPKLNGFDVARAIRQRHPNLPIIFLSARSSVPDIVKGFESGGNDYLRKPFSIKELVVRVRALLNHNNIIAGNILGQDNVLFLGLYAFYTVTNTLSIEDKKYVLTSREGEVLRELVLHRNRLLMKKDILTKIWGIDNLFTSRTMDVYIARLRKYLIHDPAISIKNVRGYGYKLLIEETG